MIDYIDVIAVIPCYNEEQSIADIVFRSNQLVGMVVVADDISSDATVDEAKRAGATVIRHFGKKGAGANTATGIDMALVKGCDIVVTLDGDGQHSPEDIPRIVEPVQRGIADMVVGSRFTGGYNSKIPKYRAFGIQVITWLYNVRSRQKLSDVQCCFRAFSQDVASRIGIAETGFSFSIEMLIKARKMGFRIREVPVDVLYHRQFSQNSSLNPIVHGLGVALGVIKWRVKTELLGKL